MQYKVRLSSLAQIQYDNILSYLFNHLKNPQATLSVMDDFDNTIEKLGIVADKLSFCKSERLRKIGLRKIGFKDHSYLLIYRIVNDIVIVEGMYHELQDYENMF